VSLPRPRKVLYTAIAVTLVLGLVEAAARVILRLRPPPTLEATRIEFGRVGTSWFDLLAPDVGEPSVGATLYLPDSTLFWRLRPEFEGDLTNVCYATHGAPITWRLSTDAAGRRITPPSHDDPDGAGAATVLCLGDSVTFGFRVSDDETWPARLGAALAARGWPNARCLNLAVPGYSSYQGRRVLDQALADTKPDIVLIAFGANDLEADARSDARKGAANARLPARLGRLVAGLGITRLLRGAPSAARTDPASAAASPRVSAVEYVENIRAMVRAARAARAEPILLDLVFLAETWRPSLEQVAREEKCRLLDGRVRLRDALDDLLAGRRFTDERAELDAFWTTELAQYRRVYYDASFYDALFADPIWSQLLRYLMIEPVHPNALGHQVLAEAIAEVITG